MAEFNIQAGDVGGEGPMNHSYDPQTGEWTDQRSKTGPDGSIRNIIGGEDSDKYITDPDGAAFAQDQENRSVDGSAQTIRTDYNGVTNIVTGHVTGKVEQHEDIDGGVHFLN